MKFPLLLLLLLLLLISRSEILPQTLFIRFTFPLFDAPFDLLTTYGMVRVCCEVVWLEYKELAKRKAMLLFS